jgi:hypothetical protein
MTLAEFTKASTRNAYRRLDGYPTSDWDVKRFLALWIWTMRSWQ